MLLLFPVFAKSKLLLFGERTFGKVVELRKAHIRLGSFYYSVIEFNVHDSTIKVLGATNVRYSTNEKVRIAYNKNNPLDCMILEISYILDSLEAKTAGFLIIVWVVAFFSFFER